MLKAVMICTLKCPELIYRQEIETNPGIYDEYSPVLDIEPDVCHLLDNDSHRDRNNQGPNWPETIVWKHLNTVIDFPSK